MKFVQSLQVLKSIKKKEKSIITIMLLTKTKLTEVLISKTLRDSYTKGDEFVSINNVLREYNELKKEN